MLKKKLLFLKKKTLLKIKKQLRFLKVKIFFLLINLLREYIYLNIKNVNSFLIFWWKHLKVKIFFFFFSFFDNFSYVKNIWWLILILYVRWNYPKVFVLGWEAFQMKDTILNALYSFVNVSRNWLIDSQKFFGARQPFFQGWGIIIARLIWRFSFFPIRRVWSLWPPWIEDPVNWNNIRAIIPRQSHSQICFFNISERKEKMQKNQFKNKKTVY